MKEKLLAQIQLPGGGKVNAPTGVPVASEGSLGVIISWVVIVLTSAGVIAALIFLILGAIKWSTSGGDREKLEQARRMVIFSIIGLVIVLLSAVIINMVGGLLGA